MLSKIAITEINSSEILPVNTSSNLVDIRLVIVTLRISSANKIVAMIEAGFLTNDSKTLPTLDSFFISSI